MSGTKRKAGSKEHVDGDRTRDSLGTGGKDRRAGLRGRVSCLSCPSAWGSIGQLLLISLRREAL